ncbi:50S ribosomal protein L25/general stress protein Ctc [Polynucleobacter sp. MWH-CaK5]|jgi:large subunit ribosomal protein L25|uniref:50S ribosomal protein L25/general stress protein Ctc n=1 Tax=Polynucleobacter sp. MWH-CaK5 TaxID=2689107 RepID=UPI001BFE6DAF|nr:50S ribosomal protein L25/general stress protein Ctc [Polynucleobacter sp. MWH-CaK5]QWD88779.1 50S ribosomal protein L25/general stress protein Ctc [Polynucleobacter sp. MWH-CaK5]
MKVVAYERSVQGTGASRRLRNAGKTPGIIYGGTEAPQAVELDHNALFHALRKEAFHSSILDIEVAGKTQKALLRNYQMHPFKPLVLHIDFQRVDVNKKIHVKVPLHFVNAETAPAVKLGGALISHIATEIEVVCLPADLPEFIQVDLGSIEVGHSIHVKDVALPKGLSLVPHLEVENPVVANARVPTVKAETTEAPVAPAAPVATTAKEPKEEKK